MKQKYIISKKAVICPVCQGEGKYKEKECHGCGGRGWVEVDESYWYYPDSFEPPPARYRGMSMAKKQEKLEKEKFY